ncbi:MAG: PHP domain-containing protein [Lachnospiraceae bacterium]|nr:PHP domain-containing protein [Lachnospiraceae bacterium]
MNGENIVNNLNSANNSNYIDLHVHSNKSDGTLSPTEVVQHAIRRGLAAIALTDHDCISGISEAVAEAARAAAPIRIVPGIEISAEYKDRDIHILGLLIDSEHPDLRGALNAAILARDTRNEKMVQNLQRAGLDITMADLLFDAKDTVITRAHFARHLIAKGYVKDRHEAFKRYLDSTTPYYVCRKYIKPEQAIQLILQAGGIPVLAHPLLYHLKLTELEELLTELVGYGLCGIETLYSANSAADEALVRSLAGKYKLLMTGGSDFHGANKPEIEIGTGRGNLRIPMELLDKLDAFQKEKQHN